MPLDPVFADRLHLLAGLESWQERAVPAAAARMAEWEADLEPYTAPQVPTREVALTAEGHRFRVRVYGADGDGDGAGGSSGPAPCLVWVHGGAFHAGDLDMQEADTVARELVVRAGAVVVSVDYSLVPEVAYPVPHRQVAAALAWVQARAGELGVDRDRVSLGGASAGGALCLAVARELVATGGALPRALVLAYPVAHSTWTADPAQEALMAGLPRLLRFTPADIASINGAYLAGHRDPRFAFVDLDPAGPVGALTGLPPALVLVCEYDDLRPSAELLVADAADAGWRVRRRLSAGMVHGHLNRTPVLAEVDASLEEIARLVATGDLDG